MFSLVSMELCNGNCVSFTSRSIVCDERRFSFSSRRRRRDAGLSICPRSLLSYQQWQSQKKRGNLVCRNCQQQEAPLLNSSTSNQTLRNTEENKLAFMLIHEKIGNTVMRKYTVDEKQSLSIEEIQMEYAPYLSNTTSSPGDQVGWVLLSVSIPQLFKNFFLPTDFPDSVSHDYLRYMIWQLPTNVTGWACSTLVTSSLLKAVGVEAWAGTTIAATAAIKWVSKDGLGAFGRLFIGGWFGRVFDDDPKQWRMYAELIGSFGSIFELMTPIKPEWFLPLAALGRLTKAVGRGLKDPSFRVIQNHFAIAGNVGEVSAKEEVWEVSAELIGIALGVALLASPSLAASYSTLVLTWASIRSLHLWFRYQSLASLQFPTINFKRAFIMAELHVIGSPIPGISVCNFVENILLPWQFSKPHLQLGCSLRDALGGQVSVSELEALLGLYSDELHVLVLHSNAMRKMDMRVIFKEGATNVTVLRCIWQAEWIMASTMPQSSLFSSIPWRAESCTLNDQISIVARSLQELNEHFDDFLHKVEQAGWETSKLVLKVPKDAPYLAISTSTELCNCKTKSL